MYTVDGKSWNLIFLVDKFTHAHEQVSRHGGTLKRNLIKSHRKFCQYHSIVPMHGNDRHKKFSFGTKLFAVVPNGLTEPLGYFLKANDISVSFCYNLKQCLKTILKIMLIEPNVVSDDFQRFLVADLISDILWHVILRLQAQCFVLKFGVYLKRDFFLRFTTDKFRRLSFLLTEWNIWKAQVLENDLLVSHQCPIWNYFITTSYIELS